VAPRRLAVAVLARTSGVTARARLLWLFVLWLVGTVAAAGLALGTLPTAQSQSLAPAAATYVQQSAQNDLFAIDAGRLALRRSQNPRVREFARQMMTDHSRSTASLKTALRAADAKLALPTALDTERRQDLARLKVASVDDFDLAYLHGEIQRSRNALDLQRAYAQSGDNPSLRRVASQVAPVVQRHLVTLETLAQESLFARMCEAPQLQAPPSLTARLG
jgi:putative membrane protein